MPPSSPASSEGSTGMVPYSHRIRGSVSRRDRRMMNRSCSAEGGLRVRQKASRVRVSVDVGYRRQILIQATEALNFVMTTVTRHTSTKGRERQMFHQLSKDQFPCVHQSPLRTDCRQGGKRNGLNSN